MTNKILKTEDIKEYQRLRRIKLFFYGAMMIAWMITIALNKNIIGILHDAFLMTTTVFTIGLFVVHEKMKEMMK